MTDRERTTEPVHANVVIKPPVLWILLLIAGVIVHKIYPLGFLPARPA